MTNVIEKVVADQLCVGCGMCAGMFATPAATMQMNTHGFLRPVVVRQLNQTEAGLFEKVCPGRSIKHPERDASFHTLWGPIKTSATGFAMDDEVRFKGSSGGALSARAIHLLDSGAVQGVVHIAPSDTAPFDNVVQISTSKADVLKAAGSRYAPASPLTLVNDCMQKEGMYAFIGKPCDVAALRALGREQPAVAQKFPYLLSFMCAGTPSLIGTEAVVREMGFEPRDVVKFRYRGNGWPGMARADTASGQSAEMDYDASWGNVLNRHLQFRCKICPDGTGEFADVACADAWHGDEKGYPTFVESAGRSLILGRTQRGADLLASASAALALATEPLDAKDIERMQPYQATRKMALQARIFGMCLGLMTTPTYTNLGLSTAARMMSLRIQAKNFLGTWLRVVGIKK